MTELLHKITRRISVRFIALVSGSIVVSPIPASGLTLALLGAVGSQLEIFSIVPLELPVICCRAFYSEAGILVSAIIS